MSHASEFTGKTVDDAVAEALLSLGARRDEVEIVVLDAGRGGLLGFIGAKPARVRVTRKARPSGGVRPPRPGGERERAGVRDDARPRDRGGAGRGGRENREQRENRDSRRENREPRENRDNREARADHEPREARAPAVAAAPGTEGERQERSRSRRRGGRGRGRRGEGERDRPRDEAPRPAPPAATVAPQPEAPTQFAPRAVEASPAPAAFVESPRAPFVEPPRAASVEPPRAASVESPRAADVVGELVAAAALVQPLRGVPAEEAPAAIEKLAGELMQKAGFPCRCEVRPGEYHSVRITTDETSAAVLIGRHGATIDALEHLVERMVCQAVGSHVNMNLDINNYRRRREENLVRRAQDLAVRVGRTGETEHLEPLPARERRVVHLEAAKFPGVQTYTVADAEGKHVVIAPAGSARPPEAAGGDLDHGGDQAATEAKPGPGIDAGRPDETGRAAE